MRNGDRRTLTIKTLTKSSVWALQENDVFRLLELAEKDSDIKDNIEHYLGVVKSAFEVERIKVDKPEIVKKYEDRGFKVALVRTESGDKVNTALKKRPISRVTDLTYENIRYISAAKLLEVIDRNFGGGWDSLSQSIQDIIQSGFDISTTTLPKDRLHKEGGMYEKKVADGFEVLEIPKGLWLEAIFAKLKPEEEKPRLKFDDDLSNEDNDEDDDLEENDKFDDEMEDEFDDENLDEEELMAESYRTTIEEDAESLDISPEDLEEDEEY